MDEYTLLLYTASDAFDFAECMAVIATSFFLLFFCHIKRNDIFGAASHRTPISADRYQPTHAHAMLVRARNSSIMRV